MFAQADDAPQRRGAAPSALRGSAEWFAAASDGDLAAIQRLLEGAAVAAADHAHFRAAVNAVDICGRSALYLASERGLLGALRLLLKAGSDPNQSTPAGCTPLLAAVEMPARAPGGDSAADSDQAVAALLFAGASPRQPECVLAAAERGMYSTVRRLLNAGAPPAARRRRVVPPAAEGGGTPGRPGPPPGAVVSVSAREVAADAGYTEVAELLEERERLREALCFLQLQQRAECTALATRLPPANRRDVAVFLLLPGYVDLGPPPRLPSVETPAQRTP
eukprot:TRINITY_DN50406_c0_g1_i1.p3 TRINITY_DN50406_c0_g1~~TRINITY_DN50406_c0_g1_i1.p3  ORF type:complete len:301 (+),score=107.08 TRINITY_DN50406_c0_g1_i1:72-905(+)